MATRRNDENRSATRARTTEMRVLLAARRTGRSPSSPSRVASSSSNRRRTTPSLRAPSSPLLLAFLLVAVLSSTSSWGPNSQLQPLHRHFRIAGVAHAWTACTFRSQHPTRHRPLLPSSGSSAERTATRLFMAADGGGEDREPQPQPQRELQRDDGSTTTTTATKTKEVGVFEADEDLPAGIEGAQFFGGNKEKEEFYDPVAEAEAGEELRLKELEVPKYDRFAFAQEEGSPFQDELSASVAKSLQSQINSALYGGGGAYGRATAAATECTYSPNLRWDTPFSTNAKSPVKALEEASKFYRAVDVAIVGGRTVEQKHAVVVELRWEISVMWPTVWEPRILLTGTSLLTLDGDNDKRIVARQIDSLDAGNDNLAGCIAEQISPRFWDIYHIGMTPCAELSPKLVPPPSAKKGLLSRYELADLPPRLYMQPQMLDLGTRQDSNAGTIPNHAFTCVIKTMGPQKQKFVPTSPVQVQLVPTTSGGGENGSKKGNNIQLRWLIPLSVESVAKNPELPLPAEDDEADPESDPDCRYVYQPRRRVATVPYGGAPQDPEITKLRQQLYEQVVKDGLKPKLDAGTGRPVFFFWQNSVKACHTEEGLGMAVYEWRPGFSQSKSAVGIELEL